MRPAIAWGTGACPDCGHQWAQHAIPMELAQGIVCHGSATCHCQRARAAALLPPGEEPPEHRVEGEYLAHLDAVALAARQLFEALQHATAAAMGTAPAIPPATECRHCGRAIQLTVDPWENPLRASRLVWVDAQGSPGCRGQGPTDPGTYLQHEPVPVIGGHHRCPHCQRLHAYPLGGAS